MRALKNKILGIKDLTRYVIFSITMCIIYTVIAIIFQGITHEELSSTLTTCFYSVFGGEMLVCGFIKIFKITKGVDVE